MEIGSYKILAIIIIVGMLGFMLNMPEEKHLLGILLAYPVGVVIAHLYHKFIKG